MNLAQQQHSKREGGGSPVFLVNAAARWYNGDMAGRNRIIDTAKSVDRAVDTVKATDKAIDAAKIRKSTIHPSDLTNTHKLTLSRKQYENLFHDIKENGIEEPIKYVENKGRKYVVDGHHRLHISKQLNIKDIPAEKVSLPYKGYKTIKDVLWFD